MGGLGESKGLERVRALAKYRWFITTGLLGIILGFQLVIWNQIRNTTTTCSPQVGGDHVEETKYFPTEVVQWKADYEFVPLNATEFLDPKVQTKWETLYPAGAGFGPGGLVYNSTSVTHQLHCVYIMGKIFSAVLTNSPDLPEPDDYEAHFLHCIDYMRQAAMCAGDLAVEPRGEDGQPGPVNLDNAFNGRHVCKDYTQVKSYLEEQLSEGKRNILPLDD
ncbi:hypothetical protein J7T55_012873 [Diaporthe amygdali]|uniref:uncharacterized protein n=1 Tax=Phomopsis amygdali TaxID=1214568 RepID=UPI0022FF323C|nr:uncharacterized protein J7T55_012873 [Diaporthe amygdali]KAJ0118621.1 hypothetical protein J7T55_012873 [Diaporthe amygdali]